MNEETCKPCADRVTAARMRALALVLQKARMYKHKKVRHYSIVVFTKNVVEIDCLQRTYGGNHYPHLAGFIWVLGKRKDLEATSGEILHILHKRGTDCR